MEYSLECALHAQRAAAEKLAEHFAEKNDDKGIELFDELLSAQQMILVVMNDLKRRQWQSTKIPSTPSTPV
jgi:hypothetical protein